MSGTSAILHKRMYEALAVVASAGFVVLTVGITWINARLYIDGQHVPLAGWAVMGVCWLIAFAVVGHALIYGGDADDW